MSFTVEPKPVVETDDNNVKFISKWKITLNKQKSKYFNNLNCETRIYKDLKDHPSLFYNSKNLGIEISDDQYEYEVTKDQDTLTILSKNLDVLKLAVYKLLSPQFTDKRMTIKRQWKINLRPLKIDEENNEDWNISFFNDDDTDY
tara:strand:- start:187 stop:621 length:435 start_codon:yes stop_codon:yes gene_type:complete